jgi:leucyl aminopeptidase
MPSISFGATTQSPGKVRADLLAVPVFAERRPGPGAEAVDAALSGGLATFLTEAGFSGKLGEVLAVPTAGRLGAKAALLVGLGPRDEVDAVTLRRAAAAIARRATKAAVVATTLAAACPDRVPPELAAQAVAEGATLGAYKFLEYKSDDEPTRFHRLMLIGVGGAAVADALERARIVTHAVSWARDRVNEPSGDKSPADFAAAARKLLTGSGVTVTILTEPQLQAQHMGGVLGVGQGSSRPPRFVKAVYEPPGSKARGTLALVGKGITFDSGGLSLKNASGMETMKTDMSGAAAVLATMSTLKALGVRSRVIAYAPLAENMPSGTAIRPGDVLHMRSGKTVEVLNTDAEGRLVLADALSLAVSDKVDAIVDVATLTGACVVALGEKVAGVMGNQQEWVGQVRAAADRAGEAVWPLPLPADYRKLLESEVADLRNISTNGYGGALTAGLFLEAFVDRTPWVHLDIAGPARSPSDDGELTKGGTGFGVRTLTELVRTFDVPAPLPSSTKKTAAKTSTPKPTRRKPVAKKTAKRPAKKAVKKGRTARS